MLRKGLVTLNKVPVRAERERLRGEGDQIMSAAMLILCFVCNNWLSTEQVGIKYCKLWRGREFRLQREPIELRGCIIIPKAPHESTIQSLITVLFRSLVSIRRSDSCYLTPKKDTVIPMENKISYHQRHPSKSCWTVQLTTRMHFICKMRCKTFNRNYKN